MFRWATENILFRWAVATLLVSMIGVPHLAAQSKDDNNGQEKHIDIQSSAGDLHVGSDADARKAGLPLYPGARLRHDDQDNGANLSLFTEAFGVKLVVAKYDSDDAPGESDRLLPRQIEKIWQGNRVPHPRPPRRAL